MKEYLIVELETGNEVVVIDSLFYNDTEYFFTAKIINSNMDISDDFDIQIYDNNSNTLLLVSDESIDAEIRQLFEERLEENIQEYQIMKYIDSNSFVKLKVLDVNNTLYKMEYNDRLIEKYMHFYDCVSPKVGDDLYISKNLIDENVLSYGPVGKLDILYNDEVILLVSSEYRYYYKRYYG